MGALFGEVMSVLASPLEGTDDSESRPTCVRHTAPVLRELPR